MTVDRLREFRKATPYRPFVLHLADGRSLRVDHPELIAMSPNGRTAAVFGPKDSLEVVDLLLVTSIELGNGTRRRQTRK